MKRFYARTNKIKFARGIAKQQRRERLLHKLRQNAQGATQQASDHSDARETDSHPTVRFSERELLPQCSPESQYQISNSRRLHWDITAWLHRNREDAAVKVCSHLLPSYFFLILIHRTFYRISKTISLLDCLVPVTRTSKCSHQHNATRLLLLTTRYTGTKSFASIILHMTFVKPKTRSTPACMLISWFLLMRRANPANSHHIHTGMHVLWEFSMSTCDVWVLSLAVGHRNALIFFGCVGFAEIQTTSLVGQHDGCIGLVFLMRTK